MDLIERFLQSLRVEQGFSKATIDSYRRELRRFESRLGNNWPELSAPVLQHYLSELGKAGLGPRTVFHNLAVLRSFYRFLLEEEIITRDPSELVEFPKLPSRLPKVVNLKEFEKMLAVADDGTVSGLRDRAMLEVLFDCGLRVSELNSLKLENLHLEDGHLTVWGKGGKERVVMIGEYGVEALKKYLRESRPHYDRRGNSPYLFLNRQGQRLSRVSVFKLIRKLALLAGVKAKISPHTLRHSFATASLEGGMDLIKLRDLLGHASVATTQIYTHLDRRRIKREYDLKHPRSMKRGKT